MSSRPGLRKLPLLVFAPLLAMLLLLPAVVQAQTGTDAFSEALEKGPIYAAAAALLGGFLVSLTPCVYPMIVITVSVFGAREAKSRGHSMLLSTCFVFGIIAMFVPLGVIAGVTGSVFGSLLSNRWVNVGLCLVFVALAASMFGAFEMVLPDSLMQRLSGVGGIGFGGAFLLGLVSGIVAAPCTGPVLTGILLWIGKTQSIGLGVAAMTAFALGLGVPFWIVGTFAVSLPKSGKWMMWVKSVFGIIMVVAALYFLRFAFPAIVEFVSPSSTFLWVVVGVTVTGLLIGAVHLDWSDDGIVVKLRKGVGLAMSSVGGFLIVANLLAIEEPAPGTGLTFLHSEPEATALAKAEKRPLLVDFTADWCVACGKLSRQTFADPRVREKASNFVGLKIDVTIDQSLPQEEQDKREEEFDAIQEKYGVLGLPTVILYDSTGKERYRLTDFMGPDEFLEKLDGIE